VPEETSNPSRPEPRPFWSGNIAFGLISLPVSLYAATRRNRVALRMVDADGTPLRRRYYCPRDERVLTADEIVRGYEVEAERFVVVEDEELDAVAPDKAREIDLRRFVPLADIDRMYFNRAYFLTPDEGAIKAYRLLAQSMQDEQRAGIATVVMRGTQYLIAIVADRGILRAETLRFHDELRRPQDIGLPALEAGDKTRVERLQQSIRSRRRKTLPRQLLADHYSAAVRRCIKHKLDADKDVIPAPTDVEAEQGDQDGEGIDLMRVLKDSLQQQESSAKKSASATSAKTDGKPEKNRTAGARQHDGGNDNSRTRLQRLSKSELYRRAQRLDLSGRSNMTKAELARAINRHH